MGGIIIVTRMPFPVFEDDRAVETIDYALDNGKAQASALSGSSAQPRHS